MGVKAGLEKVHANRLMRNEEEITTFEESLAYLIGLNDNPIITELCKAFDDDTEHHEVMYGLVHGIEHLYDINLEDGLRHMAIAVPSVIDRAREWVETMHYRILNHEPTRMVYGQVLTTLDSHTKEVIIKLLCDIRDDNPDQFSGSVDEVLKGVG